MRWFRGASESSLKELKPSDKYEMVSEKLHRTLMIKNCDESDKDTYWCQVGKVKCSAPLEIAREFIDMEAKLVHFV